MSSSVDYFLISYVVAISLRDHKCLLYHMASILRNRFIPKWRLLEFLIYNECYALNSKRYLNHLKLG